MAQLTNFNAKTCQQTRTAAVSRHVSSRRVFAPFVEINAKALKPTAGALAHTSQRRLIAAKASASAAIEASNKETSNAKEWFALVANADFMLNDVQNESLAEQLREKTRFYKEQGKEIDFFIVPNPAWLDTKFPDKGKQVSRPCVALMSTDKVWITFMKLRLDRVLMVGLGSTGDAEALKSAAPLPEFKPPEKWIAPYPRYAPGWWNLFLPK